jgi:hypothetical protein
MCIDMFGLDKAHLVEYNQYYANLCKDALSLVIDLKNSGKISSQQNKTDNKDALSLV